MKLKVLTPNKLVIDQEVSRVTLPGSEGEMTILPMHAAMVATLKSGKMKYQGAGKESMLSIDEGYVEVLKDQVLVMIRGLSTEAKVP